MRVTAYIISTLTILTALSVPASANHLPPTPHVPPCSITPVAEYPTCAAADAGAQADEYSLWADHTRAFAEAAVEPIRQDVEDQATEAQRIFWEEEAKRRGDAEATKNFAVGEVEEAYAFAQGQANDAIQRANEEIHNVECNIIGGPACNPTVPPVPPLPNIDQVTERIKDIRIDQIKLQ